MGKRTIEGTDDMADYEKAARFLFDLLDDIDTVSDMAKADDAEYRETVEVIQRRRFEVADVSADAQTVTFR